MRHAGCFPNSAFRSFSNLACVFLIPKETDVSCFLQHYAKPFCDCAMITEGEFCNSMDEFSKSMDEFSKMTTKFVQFFGDMPFFGMHHTFMKNLGIHNVPKEFHDLTRKQVFDQGQPIIRARTFLSGEVAIGIDWMCMLLLLSISGSSRIDQQLGKNVAMNIVAELFNKVPFTMFPYDAIQVREFNPHMPAQEIVPLRSAASRCGCVLRPNNRCVLDDTVPMHERVLVPTCSLAPNLMMEVLVSFPSLTFCSHFLLSATQKTWRNICEIDCRTLALLLRFMICAARWASHPSTTYQLISCHGPCPTQLACRGQSSATVLMVTRMTLDVKQVQRQKEIGGTSSLRQVCVCVSTR